VVERFTLDAGERVEAAFQIKLLGNVLVEVRHTTLRMRAGDHAEGPPIRQVPPESLCIQGLVAFQMFGSPTAIVCLLWQFASCAKGVEQLAFFRLGLQEALIDIPEGPIGCIVELETMISAKHGHRCLKLIERTRMGLKCAAKLALYAFKLGNILSKAGIAVLRVYVGQLKHTPLARCHNWHR